MSANKPARTVLHYFVAVTAATIVAVLKLSVTLRFKGVLLIDENAAFWLPIFAAVSFICASVFGLLPFWIARACARRFAWRRPWPFVVLGALASLSAQPALVQGLPLFGPDLSMVIDFPLIEYAIPGAVGGFVYWLCVRRSLPLSPEIR